jgi:tyrosine-protein kinase Etk/Wzc
MNRQYPQFSLLELVEVVAHRRLTFLVLVVLTPILAWAASYLIPGRYEAVSSLLPVQSSQVQGYSSVLERGVIRGGLRIRESQVRNSLNLERLLGRQLRFEVVEKLGLIEFFELEDVAATKPEHALALAADRLLRATHLELSLKVRVLIIHVVTRDPSMSAAIANTYVELLDRHNLETIRQEASNRVAYLDTQLDKLQAAQILGRTRLAEYQESSGITDLDLQMKAAHGILADMRSYLLDLEILMQRLEADYEADHPERRMLSAEIDVYRNMIARFTAQGSDTEASAGEYLVYLDFPLGDSSQHSLSIEYLEREVELLDAMIAALVAERERSRMEQFLDVSTTSVLDHAIVPADPIWPQRKFIVLVSTFITLTLAYLFFFARVAFRKLTGGGGSGSIRRFLAES